MTLKDTTKFATTADIRQKLNNSIVMYGDIPVWCSSSGDTSKIAIFGLVTKDGSSTFKKEVEYNDEKLIIQSPPLGYLNSSAFNAVYVSRVPSRRFTIGVTRDCLEFKAITGVNVSSPIVSWPWSEPLHNTLANKYPDPMTILQKLHRKDADAWSQAFSRTLAFGYSKANGLRVFHKNTPIAYYNQKEGKFYPQKEGQSLVENILIKHGIKYYAA